MRQYSIDSLKLICALLIILLHVPTPCHDLYLPLTRCAVPIFFMISGYMLYGDGMEKRIKKSINKILYIILWSSCLYACFNFVRYGFNTSTIIPSTEQIKEFLFFNENPWGFHLWYLGAYLYVLVITYLLCHYKKYESVLVLIPFLLLTDLVFGKYSILFWGKEFNYLYVRNFLFVGLPYFMLGSYIRKKQEVFTCSKKVAILLTILFCATTLFEKYLLVANGINAIRDHYLSTTFLAISVFLLFVNYNQTKDNMLSRIGRQYSLYIYLLHPICFILLESAISRTIHVESIVLAWQYFRPLIIFLVTMTITWGFGKVGSLINQKN